MKKTLQHLVQSYFTRALPERGTSPLTILSYRDAVKLLLRFACEQLRRPVVRLDVADLDDALVRKFLAHLQAGRGNQISTRNNRLAAIRSFFSFVGVEEPLLLDHCRRVCGIPLKKGPTHTIRYLEKEEMRSVIGAPIRKTPSGQRDHAMLLFLYNTGARVAELVAVRPDDLQLVGPAHVVLHGKGNKTRICPLWKETAAVLRDLLRSLNANPAEAVFRNRHGAPITRFGVDYVLKTHVASAAEKVPSLRAKRVSPHTIRHTTAVHLLNAGVNINVIRSWLGHVDLRTTNIYTEIEMSAKRDALEKCAPKAGAGRRTPSWKRKPDLLTWLEEM